MSSQYDAKSMHDHENKSCDVVLRHRHSHSKTNTIIDRIKTRLQRKNSKNFNRADSLLVTNGKQTSPNRNQEPDSEEISISERRLTFTNTSDQSLHLTETSKILSCKSDDENTENEHKNLSNNKNEPEIDISKQSSRQSPVRWQLDHVESEIRLSTKQMQTKPLPSSTIHSNTKTRERESYIKSTNIHMDIGNFNHIFNQLISDEQLLVLSITKEKSTEKLPNAIKLRTKTKEQYLFATYIPRERIFTIVNRVWQNNLLEQPLKYEQLRNIINNNPIQNHMDGSSEDSDELIETNSHTANSLAQSHHSQSLPQIRLDHSQTSSSLLSSLKQDSLTSPKQQKTTFLLSCPCETHLAKTLANRLFLYDVDTLFDLIFGDNLFTRTFHEAQKLYDYRIGEWYCNDDTNKRERQVTYRTVVHSILGTNTLYCTEKQVIELEKPNLVYVVRTDVHNGGMRYTDAFYVSTQYCLCQHDAACSSLRVSAELRYVKSVNAIAKAFIEKNANGSVEGGVNHLVRRLINHQNKGKSDDLNQDQTLIFEQELENTDDNNPDPYEKNDIDENTNHFVASSDRAITHEQIYDRKGYLLGLILISGLLFMLLHVYLCYKLYTIDQVLHSPNATCVDQCKKDCLERIFYP